MAKIVAHSGEITQGTIVDDIDWPNVLGIVVTNACDIEHENAEFVTIAALVEAKKNITILPEFHNKIQGANETGGISKNAFTSLVTFVQSLIHNKNIIRYFFVCQNDEIGTPDLLVDFQNLITIPIDELVKLRGIAQLPAPYIQQMIVHYTSYNSRIAVERLGDEQVASIVDRIVSPIHIKPPEPIG